jgi:hypothetical protein
MTTRVTCHCDGCGQQMPAEKLRPLFTVQRAAPRPTESLWDAFNAAADQQWRPLKLGDLCQECMAEMIDRVHVQPRELEPGVVDRILEGLNLD